MGLNLCKQFVAQRLILTSIFVLKIPVTFSNLVAASLHFSQLTFHTRFIFRPSQHSQLSSHATFCLMC